MTRAIVAASAGILLSAAGTGGWQVQVGKETAPMNALAERYVKTVLAVGQHDTDYVDAYYGPPEWKRDADASKIALESLLSSPSLPSRLR